MYARYQICQVAAAHTRVKGGILFRKNHFLLHAKHMN